MAFPFSFRRNSFGKCIGLINDWHIFVMSLMRENKKKEDSFVKCSLPSNGYCQFSSRVFCVSCRKNWIPMSKWNFCKANTHGNWLKHAFRMEDECFCVFLMLKDSFTMLPTWLICFTAHLMFYLFYSLQNHHKWLIIFRAFLSKQFSMLCTTHKLKFKCLFFSVKCHTNIGYAIAHVLWTAVVKIHRNGKMARFATHKMMKFTVEEAKWIFNGKLNLPTLLLMQWQWNLIRINDVCPTADYWKCARC